MESEEPILPHVPQVQLNFGVLYYQPMFYFVAIRQAVLNLLCR